MLLMFLSEEAVTGMPSTGQTIGGHASKLESREWRFLAAVGFSLMPHTRPDAILEQLHSLALSPQNSHWHSLLSDAPHFWQRQRPCPPQADKKLRWKLLFSLTLTPLPQLEPQNPNGSCLSLDASFLPQPQSRFWWFLWLRACQAVPPWATFSKWGRGTSPLWSEPIKTWATAKGSHVSSMRFSHSEGIKPKGWETKQREERDPCRAVVPAHPHGNIHFSVDVGLSYGLLTWTTAQTALTQRPFLCQVVTDNSAPKDFWCC